MYKNLVKKLIAAHTEEELNEVLYGPDGVDRSFEKDKISWEDHEDLFKLAERLSYCF